MTDTQTSTTSFVEQLESDAVKYKDSTAQEEYCAQIREQAAEHFLELFLSSPKATKEFEELALHRNKMNQQTARLAQWQGRGPTYLDQSLSDLLDLGDLLQRMQDHLDATYGAGKFRVFNHRVRGNRNRLISLTVSWDSEGFENVDSIVENNRKYALERQQRQQEGRTRDDGEDDGCEEDELPARHTPRRREGGNRQYDDRAPRRRDGARNRQYEDRAPRRHDDRAPRYEDEDRAPRRRQADRGPRDSAPRPSRRRAAVTGYDQ